MNWKLLVASAAFFVSQSFAIIGIGFHYAPNFGTKLKAAAESNVYDLTFDELDLTLGSVKYKHGGFEDMQGFGAKLWIDFLPLIDIEGTYNVYFGSYNASLALYDYNDDLVSRQKLEVEFDGVPFGKATPKFVAMNGDLSITLPITSLPIIRPYIGGGITYFISTPVLTSEFVSKFLEKNGSEILLNIENLTEDQADELADQIIDAIEDEGFPKGLGGHIIVGFRLKLPIIPVAAYANYKYYFGGDFDDAVDFGRHVVELGAGFAI